LPAVGPDVVEFEVWKGVREGLTVDCMEILERTAWLQDWLGRRAEPFADSDRVDDSAEAAEGVPEACA